MPKPRVLVTGAGGFIGHHLVKFLKAQGYWVRGVDIKLPAFETTAADEFFKLDLRKPSNSRKATQNIEQIYMLAANMGGIGYIETVHADIMRDNVLIDTLTLEAAQKNLVKKVFYASSACVYPTSLQLKPKHAGLKETEAYPAQPDNAYGWEKLFTEQLLQSYTQDYGLDIRIARFHNVYGPLGSWTGGREKSPAAICRKVAEATSGGEIEVWGDGKQGRSYCYIDDCVLGIYKLMESEVIQPINLGSDRLISINQLVELVTKIAKKQLKVRHDLAQPQGVRGRNSDNQLIKSLLGWAPAVSLEIGLAKTYHWIEAQVKAK